MKKSLIYRIFRVSKFFKGFKQEKKFIERRFWSLVSTLVGTGHIRINLILSKYYFIEIKKTKQLNQEVCFLESSRELQFRQVCINKIKIMAYSIYSNTPTMDVLIQVVCAHQYKYIAKLRINKNTPAGSSCLTVVTKNWRRNDALRCCCLRHCCFNRRPMWVELFFSDQFVECLLVQLP